MSAAFCFVGATFLSAALRLATPTTPGVCPFAQPAHHRFFPSAGSPRLATFRPHPSHFFLLRSTAPACPFAQPAHHRFLPSAGSPRLATFRPQPSHFLLVRSSAPACPFAQPEHHRFLPSAGSPKFGCFSWQPSHFFPPTSSAPACPFAQPAHHRFFPPSASSPRRGACGNSRDHPLSLRRWQRRRFYGNWVPRGFRNRQAEGTARPPQLAGAPLATFAQQSSHRVPRCSARSTAPARSFSPKPFRTFSPMSIAMACCHTFRSLTLSGFPHRAANRAMCGYVLALLGAVASSGSYCTISAASLFAISATRGTNSAATCSSVAHRATDLWTACHRKASSVVTRSAPRM